MNGQRFHQQKRIETKTEQCECRLSELGQALNFFDLDSYGEN